MQQHSSKCLHCRQYRNCRDSYTSWFFFIIGIIATIAIRAVTILDYVDTLYGKIAWYTGVMGFFIFFVFKFLVNQKNSDLIRHNELLEKISQPQRLTSEDCAAIESLLCSLTSRKEKINYFLIFFFSALALVLAIYMDFLR